MIKEILPFILGLLVLVVLVLLTIKREKERPFEISFKQALDLTDLPVITLYQGDARYNMLIDSGSNRSYIDKSIVHKLIDVQSKDSKKVVSATSISHDVPFLSTQLSYKNYTLDVTFGVMDLQEAFAEIKKESGVQLHGILGTDICTKYKYIIDFNDCLIYTKK